MAANFYMGKWQGFPDDCYVSDGKQRIKLEPKAMDLLVVLAEANGQLVSRDDIFSTVWKNQIIADHVLYNLIANLRKILEDNPQKPTLIITVPKKGYRLGQQVEQSPKPRSKITKPKWLRLVSVAVGIIILAIVVFWTYKPSYELDSLSTANDLPPSIAVLPFDIYDPEPNLHYFADGLSEEIIHQLTAIPQLAVVSRTSSFAFRDKALDIKTIANKLNSQFVLEGSIRKSAGQLRVTIQLIQAKTGTHLWSKVFTITENDVFKLQQDISLAVVDSLLPNYGKIPTDKLRLHPQIGDAYMHYLRGHALVSKGTVEFIQKGIKEFQKAVELQADYALAHVSIALNTMVLYQHRVIGAEFARDIAQTSINTALALDPYLASAHTAQGLLYINYDQFSEAEASFITALNLDPSLPLAHHNYGYLLWMQDKHEQALDHFKIALARNPMSAITNFAVADSLFVTGQLDDALRQYEHCVALMPDYPSCRLGIANFYRFTNQPDKVQQHMLAAKQLLAEDNIYWRRAKAVDEFWQGNFASAVKIQNEMSTIADQSYLSLQIKTLMNIKLGKAQDWLATLQVAAQQSPNNSAITLAIALNQYYAGNCPAALTLYESVLTNDIELHGKFNVAAWGVSHIANMADCYQQKSDGFAYEKMMQSLTRQTIKFQTENYVIPGLVLIEAKIDVLSGKPARAKSKLKNLHGFALPLKWLTNVDPIFSAL